MKLNPRTRLMSGIPKKEVSKKRNPIKNKIFNELDNGVVGAIGYTSKKAAQREFNAKGYLPWFEAEYPGQIFDYKVVQKTIVGYLRGADWGKIERSLLKSGSPYKDSKVDQTRAADEGGLTTVTDLLHRTKDKIMGNPLVYDVIVTIPHAHDDGVIDGHDTDWLAPVLGDLMFESLRDKGVETLLLEGEVNRDDVDLNRKESHAEGFHTLLDQYLPKADMLFDIHSYPTYYPVWNEYDIVLFHSGPYHTDKDNATVQELATAIKSAMPEVSVFLEIADEEKHYIQNKGLILGKDSFLIEINESRVDIAPDLAEVLANFVLGVSDNPPTKLPSGAKFHAYTIRLPLSTDPAKPKKLVFPAIMELELEERGFKLVNKKLDPTDTLTISMSFALPPGFPVWMVDGKEKRPTINFGTGGLSGLLFQAYGLSNDELFLVADLVNEAAERQPIVNPFEPKKRVIEKLEEFGISSDQGNAVYALIQKDQIDKFDKWNESQAKKKRPTLTQDQITQLIQATTPDIDQNSTNKEIEEELDKYGYDKPEKNNKLNRSRALQFFGIVGDWSDDADIERELKKRNIKVPKKGDKLDREQALTKISGSTIVKKTALDEFVQAKPSKMNLSTPVTQAIIKALIPGARKITTGLGGGSGEKRKIKSAKGKVTEMTYEEFVKSRQGKLTDKQKKQWESAEVVKKKGEGQQKRDKRDPNEKRVIDGKPMTRDSFSKKFKPGRDNQKWKKWDNAAKANPAVVAVPSEGKFVMDVTDEVVQGARLRIHDGSPQLTVERTVARGGQEWVEGLVDDDKLSRELGNIIRINMFRRSAGFKVKGVDEQPSYIISIETGGKHFYVEDIVTVSGLAVLRYFPDKKSEPRLRVETRGTLSFSRQSKTVIVRGKPHKLYANAQIVQTKANPSYAEQYVADHVPLPEKNVGKKYEKSKLAGPIGSDAFFEQIAAKVQVFGEGQGWVRDGHLYWRKGNNADNYVNVDGLMLEGGVAWMHTHPAAWEPSQTSPDDFVVMHGMFINHGVKDFFTIIADRIDWFKFQKPVKLNEMVEVIEDFEKDIHKEFNRAESDFQRKMGDEPYLTSEQTRYITSHFNRTIPEFKAVYKAYALSPQQIKERTKRNPPPLASIRGLY